MKSCSAQILLALFLVASSLAQRPAGTNAPWVRGVVRAARFVEGKDSHETFQLQVIRNDGGSLTGMAVITREMSQRHPNHSAVEVKGVERDDRFWPYVRGEVSDDLDGEWHEVELTAPFGQAATRRIEPRTLGEAAFIDLSGFRSYVPQWRYGRLVLSNGEAALFFLENLKPPERIPETWSREQGGTVEELHPTDYEGIFLVPLNEQQEMTNFSLMSVAGGDGRVTGYFIYAGARPATSDENLVDYEEPSSLLATLQVAHDYHQEWRTIGRSSRPGEAVELKAPPSATRRFAVQLDDLRPMIGRYRYGKVLLPTDASAVIQLIDLLPPESDLIAKEHPDWRQDVAARDSVSASQSARGISARSRTQPPAPEKP